MRKPPARTPARRGHLVVSAAIGVFAGAALGGGCASGAPGDSSSLEAGADATGLDATHDAPSLDARPADASAADAATPGDAAAAGDASPSSDATAGGDADALAPADAAVEAAVEAGPPAVLYATTSATASSALASWPVTNVYDGNAGTSWSSDAHTTAAATEWLAYWWSSALLPTNYVRLMPRYSGTTALGFPVTFTVNYSNGTQWVPIASYTAFPTPQRGDPIILALPSTVSANGIQIVATTLGGDGTGNDYFQLAEAAAGFDPGFDAFRFVDNDVADLPGANQVGGVGANAFDPGRFAHWDYDDRGVVIAPSAGQNRNIYAPQAVSNGGGSWNVYFGGWDGEATGNDEISLTTTADDFTTFGAHSLCIAHGTYTHCNNESVLRLGPGRWWMVYTTYPDGTVNKPAYATSTDGVSWTPSSGDSAYLLGMSGYANWTAADVNGGNTILVDAGGTWHLYFVDFSAGTVGGVLHATSTDGIHYTYQGQALASSVVPQDLKAFTFQGTTYYVGAYHDNGQTIWSTVGTSLSALGPLITDFTNEGAADQYMVSAGLVQDGTRVYGILYGAGPVSALDQNQIFASWLQKKVIFQNAYVRWGDVEHGLGPTNVRVFLAANDDVETGTFSVYDTDGTTLLYTSPQVTMRAGDVWSYAGP